MSLQQNSVRGHHRLFHHLCLQIDLEDKDIEDVRESVGNLNGDVVSQKLKFVKLVHATVKHDRRKDTLAAVVAQHLAAAHEELLDTESRRLCEDGMMNLAKALTLTEEERNQRDEAIYRAFFTKFTGAQLGQGGSAVFDKVCENFTVLQEGKAYSQVLMIGKIFSSK